MPILLFALALTALDVATYGVLFSVHAVLVKNFSISNAVDVGGLQVLFRVVYLQATLQIAALWLAFKYLRAPGYIAALACAVIPFFVVALVFLGVNAFTVWVLFTPNIVSWNLAEGFILLLSVTIAWLATVAIRPSRAPVIEKIE